MTTTPTNKRPKPPKPLPPIVRDIAKLNRTFRPRPKPSEYQDLVIDTTEEH